MIENILCFFQVYNDGKLPGQICQYCHMGVAATIDLLDRMVEGHHRLRLMLQVC